MPAHVVATGVFEDLMAPAGKSSPRRTGRAAAADTDQTAKLLMQLKASSSSDDSEDDERASATNRSAAGEPATAAGAVASVAPAPRTSGKRTAAARSSQGHKSAAATPSATASSTTSGTTSVTASATAAASVAAAASLAAATAATEAEAIADAALLDSEEEDGDEDSPAGKRARSTRSTLPRATTNMLKAWLYDHYRHPYPSDAEKESMARLYRLSLTQINNWFINARRRLLQPLRKEGRDLIVKYKQRLEHMHDESSAACFQALQRCISNIERSSNSVAIMNDDVDVKNMPWESVAQLSGAVSTADGTCLVPQVFKSADGQSITAMVALPQNKSGAMGAPSAADVSGASATATATATSSTGAEAITASSKGATGTAPVAVATPPHGVAPASLNGVLPAGGGSMTAPAATASTGSAAAATGAMPPTTYNSSYLPYGMSPMMFMPSPMWYGAGVGAAGTTMSGATRGTGGMLATPPHNYLMAANGQGHAAEVAPLLRGSPDLSGNARNSMRPVSAARVASRLVMLLKQETESTRARTVMDQHKMERLLQRAMAPAGAVDGGNDDAAGSEPASPAADDV